MGPSGSGKTTLLDVLAGRKTVGTVSGDVRIAGRPPTREFLRRYAGYVEQFGASELRVQACFCCCAWVDTTWLLAANDGADWAPTCCGIPPTVERAFPQHLSDPAR